MSKLIKFLLIASAAVWLAFAWQSMTFNLYFDFWTALLPVTYLISLVMLISTR